MPQYDTWQPNRHHSNVLPLFRNHLTRNAVAMFPPPLNPVAPTERECRDSRLPPVPHTGDAEEKGDAWFWGCQNYPTCTTPTMATLPVPQNLKTLLLKQQTQAVNYRIPAKMSTLPGHALGKWNGKGKYVSDVRGHHQRHGRDHWNQQVDPQETGDRRGETSGHNDNQPFFSLGAFFYR